MCEDADITISVQLPNGPKTQQQQTKLPKDKHPFCIEETSSKKLVFDTDDPDYADPAKKYLEKGITFNIPDGRKLLFVAIQADRTTYKHVCGKDMNGILYLPAAAADGMCEVLDKAHVYIGRRLQELTWTGLKFRICKEMLNCSTEADKKRVVITIAYGVGIYEPSTDVKKVAKGQAGQADPAKPDGCVPCAAT